MLRRKHLGLVSLAALALTIGMSGCTASSTPSIDVGADTVVVDVRTPSEYTGGHLDGAINIDVQSADFAAEIAELDPDVDYLVYCQSGNRSAQAVTLMEAEGLTVQDAGGIAEAESATGLTIVR